MKTTKSLALTLLIIPLAFTTLTAQNFQERKIFLNNKSKQDSAKIEKIESTSNQVQFSGTVATVYLSEILSSVQKYHQVRIENFSFLSDQGKPALPAKGQFIAIPQGANINIKILNAKYEEYNDIFIRPASSPQAEEENHNKLELDQEIYKTDQYYPSTIAWTEPEKIIRGCHVSLLWISPVQFNPVQRKIRIYHDFIVQIDFVGGESHFLDVRHRSAPFDKLFSRLIVNWQVASGSQNITRTANFDFFTGCDYLIITHHNFSEAADSLAHWRSLCGLSTKIAFVEDIGSTAENLRDYIQSAYDNWYPAPTYVTLLGDAEYVPTNYFTQHKTEDNGLIGTDLYYATVDGSDYFPDLITGRIPVDEHLEALSFVRKVINYEKDPVINPQFYNTAIVAAYFQDDDDEETTDYNERDSFEDRRFVLTSEEIRNFLMATGYQVDRIYYAKQEVNPLNYNNGSYANGEPIQGELLRANGFLWNGNATDISSKIQQGCFLISHRDHGNRRGWGDPTYLSSDVKNLHNKNRLPVVLSTNCSTGWFDNETDEAITETNDNSECFVEYWLRNYNGGAIGVFGSTRVSYSGYNDALAAGFINAIWPGYLNLSNMAQPTYILGQVLNYGKLYMATQYSSTTSRKIEFEEFHFYGDPATRIRTKFPQEFQVQLPDSMFINQTQVFFPVNTNEATVTLYQNNNILSTATSSANGIVELSFVPISSMQKIQIILDKANYEPLISYIDVYPAKEEGLLVENIKILDQNQDLKINIGETITWDLTVRNPGTVTQKNINLKLVCQDSLIKIENAEAIIDSLSSNEEINLNELSFSVKNNCPDGFIADMQIDVITSDNFDLSFPINFTVHAGEPELQINPKYIAHRFESLDDSLTIDLNLTNSGYSELIFNLQDEAKEYLEIGDSGDEWWINIPKGSGNVYHVNRSLVLKEFRSSLNIISPVTLYFFVYEGNELKGNYSKIGENSKLISEPGISIISSELLNVKLQAGKYYYLGMSWSDGEAKVSRAAEMPPFDVAAGSLVTGVVGIGGAPPEKTINQTFTNLFCFYQSLEFGMGDWLTVESISETLLPHESSYVPIKLKASQLDTFYSSNILISTNETDKDTSRIPVYLSTSTEDINLICSPQKIDDSIGNSNGQVNIGETIKLFHSVKNIGIADAANIVMKFKTSEKNIELLDSLIAIDILEPGNEDTTHFFKFITKPFHNTDDYIDYEVDIVADNNFCSTFKNKLIVKQGRPLINFFPEAITGEIGDLNDSLQININIENNGFGNLIYQFENPIQQKVGVGDHATNLWLPLKNGVGNIYYQVTSARLQEFKCLFNVASPTTVNFFVFEGDSISGTFYSINKNSRQVESPGEIWLGSGKLDCTLSAGKYYYIGASWQGEAKIGRSELSFPFSTTNNVAVSGTFNLNADLSANEIEIKNLSPLLISQKLVYGDGMWLECSTNPDTIFPGASKTVPVKLFATKPDTIFETNIKISTNDITRPIFSLPAKLTITALPSFVKSQRLTKPGKLNLKQNYPNPFNPSTEICYEVASKGFIEIKIFNVLGQKMKTIVRKEHTPGYYTTMWNGKNDQDMLVASGIYLVVLQSRDVSLVKKILLIK